MLVSPETFQGFQKYLERAWLISLGFFLYSFIYVPEIPHDNLLLPEILENEPLQVETEKERFTFQKNEKNIFVKPLFDYELWGVVVSYNNMNSLFDPDNYLGDIRAKDFCVIWGENAGTNIMEKVHIYNTNYTCYVGQKETTMSWSDFRGDQLSNNHLITNSEEITSLIETVDIGDQIYLKGMLVEYGDADHNYVIRKSSTSRADTGDGACESIFVEELKILKKSTPQFTALLKTNKEYIFWPFFLLVALVRIFGPYLTKRKVPAYLEDPEKGFF